MAGASGSNFIGRAVLAGGHLAGRTAGNFGLGGVDPDHGRLPGHELYGIINLHIAVRGQKGDAPGIAPGDCGRARGHRSLAGGAVFLVKMRDNRSDPA